MRAVNFSLFFIAGLLFVLASFLLYATPMSPLRILLIIGMYASSVYWFVVGYTYKPGAEESCSDKPQPYLKIYEKPE